MFFLGLGIAALLASAAALPNVLHQLEVLSQQTHEEEERSLPSEQHQQPAFHELLGVSVPTPVAAVPGVLSSSLPVSLAVASSTSSLLAGIATQAGGVASVSLAQTSLASAVVNPVASSAAVVNSVVSSAAVVNSVVSSAVNPVVSSAAVINNPVVSSAVNPVISSAAAVNPVASSVAVVNNSVVSSAAVVNPVVSSILSPVGTSVIIPGVSSVVNPVASSVGDAGVLTSVVNPVASSVGDAGAVSSVINPVASPVESLGASSIAINSVVSSVANPGAVSSVINPGASSVVNPVVSSVVNPVTVGLGSTVSGAVSGVTTSAALPLAPMVSSMVSSVLVLETMPGEIISSFLAPASLASSMVNSVVSATLLLAPLDSSVFNTVTSGLGSIPSGAISSISSAVNPGVSVPQSAPSGSISTISSGVNPGVSVPQSGPGGANSVTSDRGSSFASATGSVPGGAVSTASNGSPASPSSAPSSSPTSSSSSGSSPTSCTANGITYHSGQTIGTGSNAYVIHCSQDNSQGSFQTVQVSRGGFSACPAACDTTAGCLGWTYSGGDSGNCYLKTQQGSFSTASSFTVSAFKSSATQDTSNSAASVSSESASSSTAQATPGSCQSNGATYTDAGGRVYTIACRTDLPGNDIGTVRASSFNSCFQSCAATPQCNGFSYVAGSAGGICYLKNKAGSNRGPSNNVDSAYLVDASQTALQQGLSSTMSASQPTPTGGASPFDCQSLAKGDGPSQFTDSSGMMYNITCKHDIPGGDLKAVTSATFEECFGLCDEMPGCHGFSWLMDDGPGTCYLKSDQSNSMQSSDADVAVKVGKGGMSSLPDQSCEQLPSQFDSYTITCNVDRKGGDLYSVASNSFSGCVPQCNAEPQCIGFAYSGGDGAGTCYLKSSEAPEISNPNVDIALKPGFKSQSSVGSEPQVTTSLEHGPNTILASVSTANPGVVSTASSFAGSESGSHALSESAANPGLLSTANSFEGSESTSHALSGSTVSSGLVSTASSFARSESTSLAFSVPTTASGSSSMRIPEVSAIIISTISSPSSITAVVNSEAVPTVSLTSAFTTVTIRSTPTPTPSSNASVWNPVSILSPVGLPSSQGLECAHLKNEKPFHLITQVIHGVPNLNGLWLSNSPDEGLTCNSSEEQATQFILSPYGTLLTLQNVEQCIISGFSLFNDADNFLGDSGYCAVLPNVGSAGAELGHHGITFKGIGWGKWFVCEEGDRQLRWYKHDFWRLFASRHIDYTRCATVRLRRAY